MCYESVFHFPSHHLLHQSFNIIFLFRLFFQVIGLAAVFAFIWIFADPSILLSVTQDQNNFIAGMCVLCVGGVIMLIISILGCCGSLRESHCMLMTVSAYHCRTIMKKYSYQNNKYKKQKMISRSSSVSFCSFWWLKLQLVHGLSITKAFWMTCSEKQWKIPYRMSMVWSRRKRMHSIHSNVK